MTRKLRLLRWHLATFLTAAPWGIGYLLVCFSAMVHEIISGVEGR